MDKILDDMRKKYETEHKQTTSNEIQYMFNDNFCEDLNDPMNRYDANKIMFNSNMNFNLGNRNNEADKSGSTSMNFGEHQFLNLQNTDSNDLGKIDNFLDNY